MTDRGPFETAWKAAEAKAEAFEAGKPIPETPAAPEPEPDVAPLPTEEPEPPAAASEAEPAEAKPEPGEKVKTLHELAKELGMKVDARGVTVEERAGFREEKRKWHEKQKGRTAELERNVQAAQAYFAPLGPAMEALKNGDYDLAVRKLAEAVKDDEVAKEGLNGATKRYLKRAAGMDPEIDTLKRELREQKEREAAREAAAAKEAQERKYAEDRAQFVQRTAKQLGEEAEASAAVKRLASYPSFAERVVALMEQNWDGVETLSPIEAAEQVAQETRAVYDELHKVYGDQDPSTPETLEETPDAGRSGKATVGKKPKPHNGKHATEASPPGRDISAEEWRRKHARLLSQARD